MEKENLVLANFAPDLESVSQVRIQVNTVRVEVWEVEVAPFAPGLPLVVRWEVEVAYFAVASRPVEVWEVVAPYFPSGQVVRWEVVVAPGLVGGWWVEAAL